MVGAIVNWLKAVIARTDSSKDQMKLLCDLQFFYLTEHGFKLFYEYHCRVTFINRTLHKFMNRMFSEHL